MSTQIFTSVETRNIMVVRVKYPDVHHAYVMSNDDDKGYAEFYKASQVLFVKKSVEPVTPAHLTLSRTRVHSLLYCLRENTRRCVCTLRAHLPLLHSITNNGSLIAKCLKLLEGNVFQMLSLLFVSDSRAESCLQPCNFDITRMHFSIYFTFISNYISCFTWRIKW